MLFCVLFKLIINISIGLEKPSFDSRCKIYELDPCDGYGRVCLVFRENKTGNDFITLHKCGFDDSICVHFNQI